MTDLKAAPTKNVYIFRKGRSDGTIKQKELLGGKGAGLCEMARIGVNIPPGMTITTEVCQAFYREGKKLPHSVWNEVLENLHEIEAEYGSKFADPSNPLLFSV
eukprot:CAMPEP_0177600236 /NCGR_PEP_ID=MMETSP0419_2-20121207/13494_1 /TAXON_ID=582737 /ORGANISM="Tetraselmis sp., Strain GSL018" /LENGTH=102 /DNA_ID=CAMNT_0019093173 /DNA_START=187 /DNA_END=491 /DNA_ORIENTATION=+